MRSIEQILQWLLDQRRCGLLCLRVVFLLLLVCHAESLTFSYDAINVTNQGDFGAVGDDCHFGVDRADLTNTGTGNFANNSGRLVYPKPMQLWDKATGETASFTTNFTFGIDAVSGQEVGDGMAFFLTSHVNGPSNIPEGSYGGYLALFSPDAGRTSADEQVVAVEFDTFRDEWDPSDRHIGVDVNSINSFGNFVPLPNGSLVGRVMSARIVYHCGTRRLEVVLSNASIDGATYSLSASVDLPNLLPEQVMVGFSAATSSKQVAMHYVLSWSFESTSIATSQRRQHTRMSLVSGVSAATALALLLCAVVAVLLWRTRRRELSAASSTEDDEDVEDDSWPIDENLEAGSGPRPFQLGKLKAATRNFSEDEKLGQGASGSVYRGRVDELDVAIKVFSRGGSKQGKREYTAEVTVISRLRHRNLVQLIGWCDGRKRLLLVYELVPNGSLDRHLYGAAGAPVLPWPARHGIILDLGAAVLYLHEEWGQCVVHGDIKPSNIMLDESFGAKLGDFGLARLMDHGAGLQTMTAVAGTPGYLDPECIATGKASTESDVYSFGVVLLEIATGRRPMALPQPGEKKIFRLVEWAWELYGRDTVLHAADEALRGAFDVVEMELVLVMGLWCAHPDPTARPSIREALEALRSGKATKLPTLPPRMPVAMYVQPYQPAERYVVGDAFTTASATTSVKASQTKMSSDDYSNDSPSTDEYQTMYTSSGSKQSVSLLRGR